MTYWRQAGLNYLQYSAIAARILRSATKPDVKRAANDLPLVLRVTHWKDGKAIKKQVVE